MGTKDFGLQRAETEGDNWCQYDHSRRWPLARSCSFTDEPVNNPALHYIPLGWHSSVPSALTGRILNYFTPTPLSQLVAYLEVREPEEESTERFVDLALACAIYGSITRRRYCGATDGGVGAERVLEHFAQSVSSATGTLQARNDVLKTGKLLAGERAAKYRSEIVYSGPAARPDSALFALEASVPELMDDLLLALSTQSTRFRAFDMSALVLFVCLTIHPFLDGNGRLARYLAVLASASPAKGAMAAALQWWNRDWYVALAMRARSTGIFPYLDAFHTAGDTARTALIASTMIACFEALQRIVASNPSERPRLERVVLKGMLAGELTTASVQRQLNCSQRKANGVITAVGECHEAIHIFPERVSFIVVQNEIDCCFRVAA